MFGKKYIIRGLFILFIVASFGCNSSKYKLTPIRAIAELNIGESQQIKLSDGNTVTIQLLEIIEHRDSLRNALRQAHIKILLNKKEVLLKSGSYSLPITVGRVQIDCPVVKNIFQNSGRDWWGMTKDARFRVWPKDSPLLTPNSFVYPLKQKWFANLTQMSNEPTYVNEGEKQQKNIYYHADLDFGGAEGLDEVVSATDGLVISAHNKTIKKYAKNIGGIRDDVVYVIDNRGWYYRYSHMQNVDRRIQIGNRIKAGQHIGFVGKEGASGGWVHLHFGIKHKDSPSQKWAVEDAYAYVYEAYINQYKPSIIANARPHQLAWVGNKVTLDGSYSESFTAEIVSYQWEFCDGTTAYGALQEKVYNKPGSYSEILKVIDSNGNVDYDFCIVQVYDREEPIKKIPTIQTAYHPTYETKTGDTIRFFARSFNCDGGDEIWNFGDGTPSVLVNSGNGKNMTSQGAFAEVTHVYKKPGNYVAKTHRTNRNGVSAITHLHITIEE